MSFDFLRQQMVKSQLMPEGVKDEAILKAFAEVPREYFVLSEKQEIAYQDEAISLSEGRFLMRPALFARLLEAAPFKKTDRILYLGALTGYGPAILSQLVQDVTAVESDSLLFTHMQQNQARLKIANITPLKGDLQANYAAPGLYDAIFIEGAIPEIPEALKQQLHPHGFILTVLQDDEKEGNAVLWRREGDRPCLEKIFYAMTPLLNSFKKKERFLF